MGLIGDAVIVQGFTALLPSLLFVSKLIRRTNDVTQALEPGRELDALDARYVRDRSVPLSIGCRPNAGDKPGAVMDSAHSANDAGLTRGI